MQFYFDFISPFGHCAWLRRDALAAKYGRKVDWRPMPFGVSFLKVIGMKPLLATALKGVAGRLVCHRRLAGERALC